jgi:hypothetical protein
MAEAADARAGCGPRRYLKKRLIIALVFLHTAQ